MSKPAQSQTTSVPAPIGGLNTNSSVAAMPETDAITLRNMIPQTFGCQVRNGYRDHATGFTGDVGTVMGWNSALGLGVSKIFAVDQAAIYDITTPHDITGDIPITTSQDYRWQFTNFANAAGTHLIAFNGVDDGFWWSAGGYVPLVAGDGAQQGTWAGIDPRKLIQPTIHQKRLWAVEKDSTRGWYLPPEQVFGVAKSFDFGALFARGGYLQALTTWTADSGYGPDDYLVAISSGGDVAIYKGTDVNAADAWALVGVYYAGQTFTRRCFTKFGGDVAILTQFGMINLNTLMRADSEAIQGETTAKVQLLLSALITAGSTRAGWQLGSFPAQNLFIINVPGVDAAQSAQLVLSTVMNAWCVFSGMNAFCWQTIYDSLFFGTTGKVCRALEGYADNAPIEIVEGGYAGVPIPWETQQAFSYFGAPGKNKHYKMVRPTFISSGAFTYALAANMDFSFDRIPVPGGITPTGLGTWDTSNWDAGDVWAGSAGTFKQWNGVDGIGFAASIRMSGTASSELVWAATDWIYEAGGAV